MGSLICVLVLHTKKLISGLFLFNLVSLVIIYAMIQMALLFLLQMKVPWSTCVGVAPSLISSSANFKYQCLLSIDALFKLPYLVGWGFFWMVYINSAFN